MNVAIFIAFFALLLSKSLSLDANSNPISNITVIGTVFCDACSDNCFTNHSYFLEGVVVRVDCMFKVNSTSKEEISITSDRTTDRFGIYKLDIPPVDGFECKEGRQIDSFCKASLIWSPSTLCSTPALSSSTEHVSVKCNEGSVCLYNLNALYYRPGKKDSTFCPTPNREQITSTSSSGGSNLNTSLFFWPPFPPFGFPWPHWSPFPFPFPFPSPPSLPFPFPPLPFFTPPSSSFPFPFPPLPFFTPPPPSFPFPFPPLPFFTPPPPSFPFPFPPLPFFTPPPPSFPFPFPPLPPIPSFFPSPPPPPPPSFPFPFPPLPSWFTPPPPPPSPPPPSFPFPFPPFPPIKPIPSWFASPPPPSPPPPSPPPPSLPFPFPPFPPFPFPPFPPFTATPTQPSPPPPPPP